MAHQPGRNPKHLSSEQLSALDKTFWTRIGALKSSYDYESARELLEEAWKKIDAGTWGELTPAERKQYAAVEWMKLPDDVRPKLQAIHKVKQQLALCTYKDEDLPVWDRLPTALAHLEEIGLGCIAVAHSETLRLGGAVLKRMWEAQGRIDHLQQAFEFYRAAHDRDPQEDQGYGGVNAAFILHIFAARQRSIAARCSAPPREAERLAAEARDLYAKMGQELGESLKKNPALEKDYWFAATMGEVLIGLGDAAGARTWFEKAKASIPAGWELESTFRQLVQLALYTGNKLPKDGVPPDQWEPIWKALTPLLGDDTAPALHCFRGRVGLALSGGGFRASFFHLGVLARLAEMDVLRSVDVLSTVSGGSIVGAHYYLELQHLLENRPDKDVSRQDLVTLVERLSEKFLRGVEKNLRVGIVANPVKTLKMCFGFGTRSHRIGDLYEKHLYADVPVRKDRSTPRLMKDLLVEPEGQTTFKPKFMNWRRRSKVPVLLLNTTSLNSGHSWHFTASWMGEPPGLVGSDVDKNRRYRRLYYRQAPSPLDKFQLAHAVAASSCVPALFEPLAIKELFDDNIVQLVDGGVHDNLGTAALLDEGCNFVLCSDASGQMDDMSKPGDSLISVPLRSNSILMSRVREAELQDLQGREENQALRGLFFIHLKKGLPAYPLDWRGCEDPSPPEPPPKPTDYGVDPGLQKHLAGIRTDLDSFSEVEAYSLMCSGYLMTEHQFKVLQEEHAAAGEPGTWGDYEINATRGDRWEFLKLAPVLSGVSKDKKFKDLDLQLGVASKLAFKVWFLQPVLKWTAVVLGVAFVAFLGWIIWTHWNSTVINRITIGEAVAALAVTAVGLLLPWIKWALDPKSVNRGVAVRLVVWSAACVVSWVHLAIFNPLFIARGRLKRLLEL
jgi:predicted acylesterase/phospholipase RssA